MEILQNEQIFWKLRWLHIGEVVTRGADNGHLLLLGFRCVKIYFSLRIIRQLEWAQ